MKFSLIFVLFVWLSWSAPAEGQTAGSGPDIIVVSDDVVLTPGDTAVLVCITLGQGTVAWTRDDQPVSNSSLVRVSEETFLQAGRTFRQSSLHFCSAGPTDAATYTCIARNATAITANASTVVYVPGLEYASVIVMTDSLAVEANGTPLLQCVVYGRPSADITWMFNNQPLTNSSLLSITEEEITEGGLFLKRSFVQICSAQLDDIGTYTCNVSNGMVSDSASLRLSVPGAENVALLMISDDNMVSLGETAVLTCVGFARPLVAITWMYNGQPIVNSSLISINEQGVLNATHFVRQSFLELCSVSSSQAGNYTCTVDNGQVSRAATTELTVSGREVVNLLVLTADATLNQGETVLFICAGYGTPDVAITWSREDQILENSSLVSIYEQFSLPNTMGVVRESTLEICSVNITDMGEYTCTINGGPVMDRERTQLSLIGADAVQVVTISDTSYLFDGDTTMLSCVVWGRVNYQITWSFNGQPIVNSTLISTSETAFTQAGRQFRQSFLQICGVGTSNVGDYTCIVTTSQITIQAITNVVISDARLLAISDNTAIAQRDTTLLTCLGYSGAANVSYTWSFNGQPLANSSLVSVFDVVFPAYRLTQSFVEICSSSISQAGTYTCTVDDGQVSISSSTQLTISGSGEAELLLISNDTTAFQGETFLLTCVGFGEPDYQITWSRNDQTEMNSTFIRIFEEEFFQAGRLLRQSFLEVCSFRLEDAGLYTCNVSNGLISVTETVELIIFGGEDIELTAISQDASLGEGETIMLQCIGRGSPAVSATWFRNGQPVRNTSLVTTFDEDFGVGTLSTLQLCSVSVLDSGDYTCVVTNTHVALEATTTLTVSYAEVSALTNDSTVASGETVILVCVGYGQPSATFAWTRNGQPVANSSLVSVLPTEDVTFGRAVFGQSLLQICSANFTLTGDYTCTVSNGDVSASASTTISLFGIDSVQLVGITDDHVISDGDTTVLACIGYGDPPATLTWTHYGQPIPTSPLKSITENTFVQAGRTFRQSFLQICGASLVDSGPYTCSLSNSLVTIGASTQLRVTTGNQVQLVAITDNTTIHEEETTILTCLGYAQHGDVQFTWRFNNQVITNSSFLSIYEDQGGAFIRQSSLEICSIMRNNSGLYTCTISNNEASASGVIRLAVSGGDVRLLTISDDVTLSLGETALLSCSGFAAPSLEITWMFNNQPIVNSSLISIYERGVLTDTNFIRQSFLELCSVTSAHAGTYTCTLSNTEVNLFAPVEVTVLGRELVRLLALTDNALLAQGETVLMLCVGYGIPDVAISWSLEDQTLQNSSLVSVYEQFSVPDSMGVVRESTLEICSANFTNIGEYTCTISGGHVTDMETTEINLIGADDVQVAAISDTNYLFDGDTTMLSCVVLGRVNYNITWSFNGQPIVNSTLVSTSETVFIQAGRQFRQSILQICGVGTSNVGDYTCTVTTAQITIQATTSVFISDARLLVISDNVSIDQRDTVFITCLGSSSAANVSVTWSFNGQPLVDARLFDFFTEVWPRRDGVFYTQSYLGLCSTSITQAGTYTCTVSDGQVSITSSTQVDISGSGEAELLLISNATTAFQGETFLLTCVGFGEPDYQITWSRRGQTEMNSTFIRIFEEEFLQAGRLLRQSFLEVCSFRLEDAGLYMCNVSNGLISATATTRLNLFGGEDIELSAVSENSVVSEGATVVLLCIGRGNPPVSVTWMLNGQPVTNSSLISTVVETTTGVSTYTQSYLQLCSVNVLDSGDYTCVVNNSHVSLEATTTMTVSYVEVSAMSNDSTVTQGETVILVCVGYGQPSATFTWTQYGQPVSNSSLVTIFPTEDVTIGNIVFGQSLLQICSINVTLSGQYGCTVSNGDISASASTTLTLFGIDTIDIVAVTEDHYIDVRESTVLMCIGFGIPSATVTWMHYDQPIQNSPTKFVTSNLAIQAGKTFHQSFLQICDAGVEDSGPYTCIVNNNLVTLSAITQLSVLTSRHYVQLAAMTDHVTVSEGDTITLICVGYGEPEVEFSWLFNDDPIITSSTFTILYDEPTGGSFFRQSYLQICGVRKADSGLYTCMVSNEEAAVIATTQLQVPGAEVTNLVAVSSDITLLEGQTTLLTCMGYGRPSLSISWTHDSETVVNSSLINVYQETFTQVGRVFTQSFLQICSDNIDDTGMYTCSITNGLVTINASLQLSLEGAESVSLVALSGDIALTPEETPLLLCMGFNYAETTITWSRENQVVSNSSYFYVTEVTDGIFKQSFLQICGITLNDFGPYTCTVSNGAVSSDASLLITLEGAGDYGVGLISDNATVFVGETVVLMCIGYGEPHIDVTWRFNGQTLTNSSFVTIYEEVYELYARNLTQTMLQLCGVQIADAGAYACTVSIGHEEVSSVINLDITRPAVSLLPPPVLAFSSDAGTSFSFQCMAQGSPLPTVDWFKDGSPVPSGGRFQINSGSRPDGQGVPTVTSVLTVSELVTTDAGNYACRASNSMGSITLDPPFVLTVNPVTVNYCSGDPCQNGGTCTSGQTTFSCECAEGYSGPTCEIESSMLSAPMITEPPMSVMVPLLGQANFNCTATGNPNPTIQWFKDGTPIPGETEPMLVISGVTIANRGFYYCTATNSEGMMMSPQAVLNIRGLYQYTVPVVISLTASGTFVPGEIPSDEVIADISNIIDGLNVASNTLTVGTDPVYAILMMGTEGSVTTVTSTGTMGDFMTGVLVTLLDRQATPVQPSSDVLQELAALIERLANGQNQRVNVDAQNIRRFDGCSMETTQLMVASTNRGELQWDEGAVGLMSASRCPCDLVPVPRHASRVCGGNFVNRAMWMEPNTSACEFDAHAFELCDAANMDEVERLSAQTARVSALGIIIIALNIEQTSGNATGNSVATEQLLNLIDNVQKVSIDEMKASHQEFNSSSRIRGQLDLLMENYPITETHQHITRDTFGCSLYPDLSNAELSFSPSLGDDIVLEAAPTPNLTITLPETLIQDAGSSPSLAFCGYKTESLFVRRDSYLVNSSRISLQLSSGVVSARPALTERITDLTENVKIRFIKSQETSQTLCSYWDQSLDGGYGGWSEENCQLVKESGEEANCECNHLTNFAILTDTSIGPESDIQVYTILGVGVAFVCVMIVLISILVSSKTRTSARSVTIVNLCISLLCLYVSYTISHFVGSSEGACRFFSFLFHYLLLVSSTALAIMAFFTAWTPSADRNSWAPCGGKLQIISYVVAIILNWVIPLVLVIICIAAGADNYSPVNTAYFCRPVAEPYWFGLLMVGCLIIMATIVFLIIAPICIKTGYVKPKSSQSDTWFTDYLGLLFIAVFFFFGWGFGVPATHPLNLGAARIVFQVIFIICNFFQGLVMVLSYGLKVWRSYTLPGADMPHAEDNVYGGTTDDGLLFENPLAEPSIAGDSLPDYDAINLDYFEGGSELKVDLSEDDKAGGGQELQAGRGVAAMSGESEAMFEGGGEGDEYDDYKENVLIEF